MSPRVLVILGPTATGKSALASALARTRPCEIISMDAVQIYRGLDCGTAKPTPAERRELRYHLVDIRGSAAAYSAAEFRADCLRCVTRIRARGALPVICGGSMLYYKALVGGLAAAPPASPAVRAQIAADAARCGWPAMHARLRELDPRAYARLAPNDRQRIGRALEVALTAGRPLTAYLDEQTPAAALPRAEIVLTVPGDRRALRARIRARFEAMLAAGLIAETAGLRAAGGLPATCPAARSVGYRQAAAYLDGAYDRAGLVERGVIATARLAKHQLTWLRGGLPPPVATPRLTADYADPDLIAKACRFAAAWCPLPTARARGSNPRPASAGRL